MQRAAAAVVAALLLWSGGVAVAAEGTPAAPLLQDALRRAADLHLSEHPYWQVLLHYCRGVNGTRSLIDDPAFFLSPHGKSDPEAELEATLAALWAPPATGQPHASDRFPARLEWLTEQLAIRRGGLPVPRCAEVERVLERIQPTGVSLVFPSAYMNSPASLFGHTLLCLKSQFDSKLLDHAINYAADSQETNGMVFAFKGIFGLYDGRYTVVPYYAKVQQYNDIDQRDIWEYRLNLTAPEIRRLVLHVWEVRDTASRYFFFDENCAYNLLFMLDAARPGLELHRQARSWVIPLDTVRLVREAGLVAESAYRPSRATHLYSLAARLTPGQLDLAQAICRGAEPPEAARERDWPAEVKARVLDVAAEELRVRYHRRLVVQETYSKRYLAILGSRSRLGCPPADDDATDAPTPPPPDRGHRSMRLSLGGGSEDGRTYAEVGWLPAYHDELDPGLGYLPGSQIDFLNLVLRQYGDEDAPDLQRLDVIRVQSLAPRDRFFKPISWKADVGLRREALQGPDDDTVVAYGAPGAGAAWRLGPNALAYALAEVELEAGGIDRGWALGAGATTGAYVQMTSRCRVQVAARAITFGLGDRHSDMDAWVAQRWQVTTNQALSLRLGLHRLRDDSEAGVSVVWHWYF